MRDKAELIRLFSNYSRLLSRLSDRKNEYVKNRVLPSCAGDINRDLSSVRLTVSISEFRAPHKDTLR